MKKQINPTIKAHLIRGAFYLLLLVAVCAIPFALAQRNKLSSTKAQPTKAPPTKAQIAAASGKVFQSGAPGALAGRSRSEKPRHRAKRRYPMTFGPPRACLGCRASSSAHRGVRAAHVLPIPRTPKLSRWSFTISTDNASVHLHVCRATFDDFPDLQRRSG